ncbi:hypothetical protein CP533_6732 [Ophiocordyceps camponoti-saundersi (nom. inval.)]|nr:hypothetical protein CP533_6732 [Ophiocordyceps camponoti-saundersi (nom. inval.)]
MSSDTVSSLFPDRPIRPLPKRRLRERLSPEVAQSIKYPPTTYDSVSLFYYPPFTLKKEGAAAAGSEPANAVETSRRSEINFPRNGLGHGVGEGDGSRVRSALFARSPPEILSRAARNPFRPDQPRPTDPQLPPSAASSVDGYDSFENTNNKKKRKIPSAGDSAINAAHSLNSEISSLAISAGAHSPVNDTLGDRPLHGSTGYSASGSYVSNNPGFSGPGRGRLGRSRNGRSPLRALADGNNSWPTRLSKSGPSPWSSDSVDCKRHLAPKPTLLYADGICGTRRTLAAMHNAVPSSAGHYTWSVPPTLGTKPVYGLVLRWNQNPSIFQYSNPFHIVARAKHATTTTVAVGAASSSSSSSSSPPDSPSKGVRAAVKTTTPPAAAALHANQTAASSPSLPMGVHIFLVGLAVIVVLC